MDVLASRRLWNVIAILAVVGLTAWLYTSPPWPTYYNWFLDIVAFLLSFVGGIAIISQFVLPVQTRQERLAVFRHLLGYGSGWHGPTLFVKNGKLIARQKELRHYGPGVLVADAASAAVLESTHILWWLGRPVTYGGAPVVRAVGPGVTFLEPGERVVATLDLRRQARGATAKGLTREGIEVQAYVKVTFGLDPGTPPPAAEQHEEVERNRPAFPFNPHSAFRAIYGSALGEKQPLEWTDLPLTVAMERFRDVVATYTIDELFKPTVDKEFPYAEFQSKVVKAIKETPALRERGLIIYGVGVVRFSMPTEVINQRVRSWQARWKRIAVQQAAAAESQSVKTLGRWHAHAQETIVKDLQTILKSATDSSGRKALAVMLTNALLRAATEPATRRLLPHETLRTLRNMRDWLE